MTHTLVLNADMAPITMMPLSTIEWQGAIKAMFLDTVTVISEYDDWEVHSPSMTMKVPSIVMAKQYLHFQRNVAFSKEHIFLRDRYTCQYCHKVFPESKLTLDHVIPSKFGGKTVWENISTSCGPCNFKKGSNRKIVPNVMPRRPSYYELLAIRREYPLVIPCAGWADYIDWDGGELIIKDKKILSLSQIAA